MLTESDENLKNQHHYLSSLPTLIHAKDVSNVSPLFPRIEEAKGIAKAQEVINASLTKNFLQFEAINAQLKIADSPNHTTVYIPAGANGIQLVSNINK